MTGRGTGTVAGSAGEGIHGSPVGTGSWPKTNTRVTSRQLACHALSVNRSRFPLCSQIAVDGPPTDLQSLPNLPHSEATVIQQPSTDRLGFRRPLGPAMIAALPLGHSNSGRLPFLAICVLKLG